MRNLQFRILPGDKIVYLACRIAADRALISFHLFVMQKVFDSRTATLDACLAVEVWMRLSNKILYEPINICKLADSFATCHVLAETGLSSWVISRSTQPPVLSSREVE